MRKSRIGVIVTMDFKDGFQNKLAKLDTIAPTAQPDMTCKSHLIGCFQQFCNELSDGD